MSDRTNDPEHIGLSRGEARNFRTETGNVIMRTGCSHVFHSAAGSDKRILKQRELSGPVDHIVKGRCQKTIIVCSHEPP